MHDKRSQFSVVNDIMNDKKGQNIVNDIEQLFISQAAYLLHIVMSTGTAWDKEKNRTLKFQLST